MNRKLVKSQSWLYLCCFAVNILYFGYLIYMYFHSAIPMFDMARLIEGENYSFYLKESNNFIAISRRYPYFQSAFSIMYNMVWFMVFEITLIHLVKAFAVGRKGTEEFISSLPVTKGQRRKFYLISEVLAYTIPYLFSYIVWLLLDNRRHNEMINLIKKAMNEEIISTSYANELLFNESYQKIVIVLFIGWLSITAYVLFHHFMEIIIQNRVVGFSIASLIFLINMKFYMVIQQNAILVNYLPNVVKRLKILEENFHWFWDSHDWMEFAGPSIILSNMGIELSELYISNIQLICMVLKLLLVSTLLLLGIILLNNKKEPLFHSIISFSWMRPILATLSGIFIFLMVTWSSVKPDNLMFAVKIIVGIIAASIIMIFWGRRKKIRG